MAVKPQLLQRPACRSLISSTNSARRRLKDEQAAGCWASTTRLCSAGRSNSRQACRNRRLSRLRSTALPRRLRRTKITPPGSRPARTQSNWPFVHGILSTSERSCCSLPTMPPANHWRQIAASSFLSESPEESRALQNNQGCKNETMAGELRSDCQALTAPTTATIQNGATTGSLHALAESVLVLAAPTAGLIGTLHRIVNLALCDQGRSGLEKPELNQEK